MYATDSVATLYGRSRSSQTHLPRHESTLPTGRDVPKVRCCDRIVVEARRADPLLVKMGKSVASRLGVAADRRAKLLLPKLFAPLGDGRLPTVLGLH